MEAAFGEDFSGVTVRTAQARELSAIGAMAAASGDAVAFADPHPDRHTVAHELAHVVQHRRHGAGAGGISQPGDSAEHEAEAIAAAVTAGRALPAVTRPAVTRDAPPAPDRPRERAGEVAPAPVGDRAPAEDEVAATGVDAPRAEETPATPHAPALPESPHPAAAPGPGPLDAPPDRARPGAEPAADRAAHPGPGRPSGAAGGDAHGEPAKPAPDPHAHPAQPGHAGPAPHGASGHAPVAGDGAARSLAPLDGAKLSTLDTTLHQVATGVAAAHEVIPARAAPVPPALAPGGAAARLTPPPAVVPTPARAPRPIEHSGDGALPPARDRAISAGPRPRVALHGEADPLQADAVKRAGHAELDTRLAGASDRSAGDLGVSQLAAPVRTPPAPALPAVTPPPVAPPAIPKSPWHRLPAETRARLDERVAPALGARIAALRQRAQADDVSSDAELARLRGDHDARLAAGTRHAQTQLAGLRDAGATGVHALRGQWQAQSVTARDHAAAELERDHAAAEAEIQTTVRTQEGQSAAILTHAETTATGTRDAAEARARQIRADAQARAVAARARSPAAATLPIARQSASTSDGDGDARAILEAAEAEAATAIQEAQAEIDHLMASAGQLSSAQIGMATMAVARRITALRASLATKITDALHEKFPDLEKLYLGQINTLLDDTQRAMVNVGVALAAGNTAAAQQQIADERTLVGRRTQRVQDTLHDAAVLSTFDNTDKALDAFDIDMVSDPGAAGWTSAQKQLVLAQAIRIENAFRADDTAGLFAQAKLTDPGAAFRAIMNGGNGLTLKMLDRRYTDQERQDLLKAHPDKYKTIDDVPKNNPDKAGGFTKDASEIDFYSLTGEGSSTWIADATMFHLGHEMGHAFNATMTGAHKTLGNTDGPDVPTYGESGGALGTETIKAGNTAIAGNGVDRFVLTKDVLDQFKQDHPSDWQTLLPGWAQAQSEAQGMRAGTANVTGSNDYLRLLPYQQDDTNDSASNAAQTTPDSEWFADIYVNWANGTLADNAAGDALDGWMDQHMPDWIRMRLQASGKIPKDTATPTPTATPGT